MTKKDEPLFPWKASVKWVACILLGSLGFLGNWFKVELFFNVDFLFGSIFAMFAVLTLGQNYGIVTGILAATCTYFLWNHPWNVIIMGGEAVFVCLVHSRRKGNLVIYDTLYWMCIGTPLIYLFFHHVMAMEVQSTVLIMIKQAMNGIFNTLAAGLAFMGISLRKGAAKGRIAYSQAIFTVMVSLVLIPAMLFYVIGMRAYLEKEKDALTARLNYTTEIARSSLANWVSEHHQNVQTLASIVGDPDVTSLEEMQKRVEMIKAASPAFNRMGVLDKNAITIAYSPLTDENGKSTLGLDFSDRPFIPILKETKRPYVSGVVMGRIGKPAPMVPLLAPLVVAGEYRGYCTGIVELPQVSNMISILASHEGYQITVVDNKGKVIISTIPNLKVMEPFHRPYVRDGNISSVELLHWLPSPEPGISIMQRWTGSLLVKAVVVNPDYAWKLIVEAPMLPVVESVSRQSIIWLALLYALAVVTMMLSHLFSGALVATIAKLQETTRAFPRLIDKARQMEWPESKLIELEELSNNFRDMFLALSDSFEKQRSLNESLEEKVMDRTKELKEREIFIRDVLDSLTAHVAVLDHRGEIVADNEAWRRFARNNSGGKDKLLGVGANYLTICRRAIDSGCDEVTSLALEGIQAVMDGLQEHFSLEYPCHSPTEQQWFSMQVSRLSGSRQGVVVAHESITQRILAEQFTRDNEEKYRRLFENELTAICIFDMDTYRFIDVNEAFVKLYGYSHGELVEHMTIHDITVEHAASEEATHKARSDGTVFIPLRHHKKRDGTIVPVEIVGGPYSFKGKPVMFGMIRDISERLQMENALRQSEEKYRHIVEYAIEGIFQSTPEGRLLSVNPACARIFDFDSPQQMVREVEDIAEQLYLHPEDRRRLLELMSKEGRILGFEAEMRKRSGETFWMSLNSSCVRDPNGRALYYDGFMSDITDRKRAEEDRMRMEQRLQQARKGESLGRMAGAIAHNFNNMLGVVLGNLDLALDDALDGSELHANITEAMNASRRASEISRFMLTYLGQSAGKAEPFDTAKALRESCVLLSASLPENVVLRAEIPSPGPAVRGDGAQLTQIMSNLITNAVEAIGEDQGEIVLSLDVFPKAKIQGWKVFPPGWKPVAGSYVCISISDTGCGMDPENTDKVFDPFFSTKFTGRGLGLSVVLGLLRGFEGAISVESHPGKGAIFRMLIPASEAVPHASTTGEVLVSPTDAARGGLVLVVDDEAMVRNMAESMLRRKLDCEVVTASDGYEALEVFKNRKDEISLVLLDLSMPGMNGWQTLAELRSIRPDIPVILSSGYDEAQMSKGDHRESPQAFLPKPYGARDLKAAVLKASSVIAGTAHIRG